MEPERWPDLDWDRFFVAPRVPEAAASTASSRRRCSPTFAAWQLATQRYQAALIQLQVEDLRRLRHAPTGGFCQFCFADGHPAVTWSVLDHRRVPEGGYARAPRLVSDRAADARAAPGTGARRQRERRTATPARSSRSRSTAGPRRFTGDIAPGRSPSSGRSTSTTAPARSRCPCTIPTSGRWSTATTTSSTGSGS